MSVRYCLVLLCAFGAGPAASPLPLCPRTPGQAVVEAVNAQRAAHGLPALRVHPRLHDAARCHAWDQASGPDAGHRGSDGSDPSLRADRAGYRWTVVGENVAAGQTTPAEVVQVWMDSEPHRANILDGRFTEAAVGYAAADASRWGTYWVMMFGTRDVTEGVPGEACNP